MKRLISIFVTILMVTTMLLPTAVFAEEEQVSQTEVVYTDIIAEKPANFLLNGGIDTTYKNYNYAGGDITSTQNGVITYKEKANASDSYWGAGTTSVAAANKLEGISYSTEKYYVISARLKNGAPDKNPAIRAGFSYAAGRGTPVWWDVTNTQDFETYTAVFKPTSGGSAIYFGIATNVDRRAYTDDQLGLLMYDYSNGGSLYIAEETAYEVVNEFVGSNEVFAGSAATLKTEVHNQVGIKGNISQNVSYKVLNSERTEEINTITAVPNGDGTATVTVPEDTQPGEYWVLAIAGNIQSGEMFKVVSENTFTDWVPGKLDDNLITTPNNPSLWYTNPTHTDSTTYQTKNEFSNDGYAGYGYKTTATVRSTYNGYQVAAGARILGAQLIDHTASEGEHYVIKFAVRSLTENTGFGVRIGMWNGAYSGLSTDVSQIMDYENGIAQVPDDGEWHTIKGTFPALRAGDINDSGKIRCIVVGMAAGTPADVIMELNNHYKAIPDAVPYFAKEKAHNIKVTGASNTVAVGEAMTLGASVENQIGTEGALTQSFDWVAVNTDRTNYVDGITFDPSNDGANVTVNVADTVEPGNYIIVAQSSYGMNRQYPITVTAPVYDVTALTLDTTANSATLSALTVNASNDVLVIVAAFDGDKLVTAGKTTLTPAEGVATLSDEDVAKLTLTGLSAGNKVRVFVWDNEYTPFTMESAWKEPVVLK